MAYEIFAFPQLSPNQSIGGFSVDAMYDAAYGYDYNGSYIPPEVSVVPQVHILAKVLVGIAYCLMMSVCGIGNLLLCYVIYRFRRMRTTTNLLIGNLALSDFLVAVICAPFNFYFYIFQTWPFGGAVCVVVGYLKITSLYVSTNSLLAIAIDRYIVITYPLKPRMTRATTAILLAFIWLFSTLVTIPVAVHSDVFTIHLDDRTVTTQCAENWKNSYAMKAYTLIMVTAQFLVPLIVMSVAYYFIAKTLWFRQIPGGHNTEAQEQAAERSKRRTVRMLIIVVALFALCWAPYHGFAITRDVIIPNESVSDNYALYHTLFYIVEALAMSNSVFNTMVYIIFNANFRKCVMQMKFPRAFQQAMRTSSIRTRTSRPTSNFRMGTYQRSTGPDNKSFGLSNAPHHCPVSRRLSPTGCYSQKPLLPALTPPSTRNMLSPNAKQEVSNNSVFLSESCVSDNPQSSSRSPDEELNHSVQATVLHTHHVVADGNGTVVLIVCPDSGVGSKV